MLPGRKTKIILVADDDSDDQEMLYEALADIDPAVMVQSVPNGKEALEFLDQCTDMAMPCAIILDYNMPYLNGMQVLAKLVGNPRFGMIPKFVWSTGSSAEFISQCKANGAADYFIKPDNPNQLQSLARAILKACSNLG